MDKKILVDSDIQAGNRLIQLLDQTNLGVIGALWFYVSEAQEYRLLLVTPLLDTEGPEACYTILQSTINNLQPDFRISLDDISVLSPRDRLFQLLRIGIRTGQGLSMIRFARSAINGVFIEDSLIYRLM
jgi:hypothetical protein